MRRPFPFRDPERHTVGSAATALAAIVCLLLLTGCGGAPTLSPSDLPASPAKAARHPDDAYGQVIYADRPKAWWRLNDASGNFTDYFGHSPLTATGSPTYQAAGIPNSGNKAIALNGTSQHGTRSSASELVGQTTFSIEAWCRPDTSHVSPSFEKGVVLSKVDAGELNDQYGFDLNSDAPNRGKIGAYIRDSVGYRTLHGETITANAWHHLVLSWDGTKLRFYVDGTEIGTGIASSSPISSRNAAAFNLGVDSGGDSGWFGGSIDEAAYYGYALTSTQVTNHWNAGQPAGRVSSGRG